MQEEKVYSRVAARPGHEGCALEGLVASERWESEQSCSGSWGCIPCGSVSGVSWRKPGGGGGGRLINSGAEAEDQFLKLGVRMMGRMRAGCADEL